MCLILKFAFLFQSLGNHEFDDGVSGLSPFIKNLTCPVLAANIVLNKVPELAREHNLKKSIIIDIGGQKIGVIGYLTPDTKILAVSNDVDYIDEIVALKAEVEILQNEGIDKIIALGHSGYLKDLQIAKEVEGIDLVIGGHTNTFLWNGTTPDIEQAQGPYPTYVNQASGRSVPVVQAYAYTKYLGRLHLIFNAKGEVISADGTPILLDNTISQDREVLDIIYRYRDSILNITEAVLGYTSVVLDASKCQLAECNLGNLITDAMIFKYASEYTGEHWTDAPIAIIQGGGIRTSIAHAQTPFNITKGNLLEVMPFNGKVVTVTVNGSILLQMIEHSVANYIDLEPPGEFLQYSGIKVIYDLKKPPGSRIVSAEARCWACDIPKFSKIVDKDVYKVLMPDFVAMGGDGFWMFKDLPINILDYNELSCTQYYVTRHSPIYPQIEGRINFLDESENNAASLTTLSIFPILITLISLL